MANKTRIKIEKLTLKNLEEFFEVFKKILETSFPEYPKSLINFFLNKDFSKKVFLEKINKWLELVAKLDNKIVGLLVADELYGGVSYCFWLGVLRKYQRLGIGSLLLQEWEKEVKNLGGHKLMLLTQHQQNKDFYLRNGFKEEGFEKKSWFGLDCWKFGKVIGEFNSKIALK